MKIIFEKGLVEFRAESAEERAKLLALWQMVIDCNGTSGKLAPVGAYVPSLGQGAQFALEGIADLPDLLPDLQASGNCRLRFQDAAVRRNRRCSWLTGAKSALPWGPSDSERPMNRSPWGVRARWKRRARSSWVGILR